MLLGSNTCERLEPVCKVSSTFFKCPLFHGMRNLVCNVEVKRLAVLDDTTKFLVRWPWQAFLHVCVGKEK